MAAILKFWRRLKKIWLSVDMYLGYVNLPNFIQIRFETTEP